MEPGVTASAGCGHSHGAGGHQVPVGGVLVGPADPQRQRLRRRRGRPPAARWARPWAVRPLGRARAQRSRKFTQRVEMAGVRGLIHLCPAESAGVMARRRQHRIDAFHAGGKSLFPPSPAPPGCRDIGAAKWTRRPRTRARTASSSGRAAIVHQLADARIDFGRDDAADQIAIFAQGVAQIGQRRRSRRPARPAPSASGHRPPALPDR